MTTQTQPATFRFIAARHLSLSPLNVRKTAAESGIAQLADLIDAEGVAPKSRCLRISHGRRQEKDHACGGRWRPPLARFGVAPLVVQRRIWESLRAHERHPHTLRDRLTENDIALREPLARFVGIKSYEKAGGIVRRDLFADEDEGSMLDGELVHRLASEKLERHAAKLKEQELAWVEVHPQLDYAVRAAYGRVQTSLRAPTEQEQAQLAALAARKQEIEAQAADAEDDEERLGELSELEDNVDREIETLREQRAIPNGEQQVIAGAIVSVGPDGKVGIDRNFLKPEDAQRFERA